MKFEKLVEKTTEEFFSLVRPRLQGEGEVGVEEDSVAETAGEGGERS